MKKSLLVFLLFTAVVWADYPDQSRVVRTAEMWGGISSNSNVVLSDDGESLQLADGSVTGFFTLIPDTLPAPFDRGLPSWNGTAFHEDSGFKVSVRFKYSTTWSPWLTVGYWKNYIWPFYGETSYAAGEIDYDYVVLDDFHTIWQWRVEFKRQLATHPSPSINKLSFFVSDQRTTDNQNMSAIINDDPPEIYIPTNFVCQYNVDPEIGGSICSPTSTVLAIRSYDIEVDPYGFALDNYDDYWNLFGIWPRAVQNAAGYHLDGAVTRYRTWSQAYDTLAAGGRVIMSVGPPLYAGHLMMLAGFDSQGDPLVHDPAQQNGEGYEFSKSSISQSWFTKGGVGYTFFSDETIVALDDGQQNTRPDQLELYENFPNPFNPSTSLRFTLSFASHIKLSVFDLAGKQIDVLISDYLPAGNHQIVWNAQNQVSGVYLVRLESGTETQIRRMTLLK
ncbi:MAG: T9SS type A sorting domain-containing protein [Candidatus Marinimicrobia bacterium]|jgi:hypothetical protein|nr:T9SS type A sorting domain-containing protein [Candidatus Neomarinimicrobiota bacterium]MBT3630119.1 T9SS type A sorting domain-containing protein [Candidatus Neomarinimicrobiota bacterium]MBT3826071.1 T9SS type A sorting domain-containing protein [Candidatus Neomarinimicrobiota bacterium]MBT4132105.1 T9SS type A sorting domain-containing protein [Candidatus Neomarinimicrobiota bacterium]MBT4296592.1 T9SS type A sorting domain-containing protein [Candidatus Neomarinimicrobiota bacterium]